MGQFRIGWAETGITPEKRVSLVGQFAERISEYVEKPLAATALAISTDLPVVDGEPSYRARNITEAGTLVKSCKSYPTFLGGELNAQRAREGGGDALGFSRIRGVAYRKYFTPTCDDALMYTIPYNDEEYVYMDHFADEPRRLSFELKRGQTVQTLSSNLPCKIKNGRVFTEGCVGHVRLRVRGI